MTSPVDCRQRIIPASKGKKSGLRQKLHQNSSLNFTNVAIALVGVSKKLVHVPCNEPAPGQW